jgi:hypothetical protein
MNQSHLGFPSCISSVIIDWRRDDGETRIKRGAVENEVQAMREGVYRQNDTAPASPRRIMAFRCAFTQTLAVDSVNCRSAERAAKASTRRGGGVVNLV